MLMDFLFKQRDSKQIAYLRIAIGAWFLIDILSMLLSGYVKEAYVSTEMNFHFYGFEWIKPLPGIWMYVLFSILAVLSAAVLVGYRFKYSLSFFLVGFLYVFMCDIVYTLNKFYLFLILGTVLLFTNAGNAISLDVKRKITKEVTVVENWQILIFQVLFGVIYFYSGLSKINPDWLYHGEPLMMFYKYRIPFRWLPNDFYTIMVFIFSYCGMVFDLSIIWLLSFRRTNFLANLLQASFHILNFTILWIGSFSIFSAILTWILFPTNWLKRKLSFTTTAIDNPELHTVHKKKRIRIALIMFIFLIIQLSIPWRHHFTGNNVNWTEKGHRFSWRLMTRSKSGSRSKFIVVDNKSGMKYAIKARKKLTGRQYRKMCAETDLVITFAHYLRDEYQTRLGHDDISVFATVHTKLNGRKRQLLFDPTIDLAKISRSLIIDNISNPLKERKPN